MKKHCHPEVAYRRVIHTAAKDLHFAEHPIRPRGVILNEGRSAQRTAAVKNPDKLRAHTPPVNPAPSNPGAPLPEQLKAWLTIMYS